MPANSNIGWSAPAMDYSKFTRVIAFGRKHITSGIVCGLIRAKVAELIDEQAFVCDEWDSESGDDTIHKYLTILQGYIDPEATLFCYIPHPEKDSNITAKKTSLSKKSDTSGTKIHMIMASEFLLEGKQVDSTK